MRRLFVKFIEKVGIQFLIFIPIFLVMAVLLFMTYENRIMIQNLSEDTTNASVLSANVLSESTISIEMLGSPEAVTPTPNTTYALKSNALMLWSLYIRERYNRRGILSENGKVMYVFDIPSEVFCYVGSESYSWVPSRYQTWILDCKTYDFTDSIAFVINGTAAQGLTGGIYYDMISPFLIYGMGNWPEPCYEKIISSPITSIPFERQELNETSTPPTPGPPQIQD